MAVHSAPKQVDDTLPVAGSKRTDFKFGDEDYSHLPFEEDEIPVAIIGSSMVGMFTGALLGYHGIRSVSFDRHASTAIHPRAALFLLRTVEILRQLGLDKQFRSESEKMFDLNAGMLLVEKLYKGKTLLHMQESDPAQVAKVTPSARLWLTQNMFEPLLRERAIQLKAEQRFSQTVVHYEEVEDGVVIVVKDHESGSLKKFRTKYLVATDGNRSATREKEGIKWDGPGTITNSISVNFKANLAPYLGERAVHGTTYVTNPDITGGFRLEQRGQAGFMIVTSAKGREDGFPPDSVSEADARRYFRDATGISDEDVGLDITSISYWSVAAYCADRFTSKKGRVFLAGDAAHVMPPTGGMGGNTGVQDAFNIAWKLAFVLKGWANHSLLASYDAERPEAASFYVQQAFTRLVKRVYHGKGYDFEPEVPDLKCELGFRYTKGAFAKTNEPGAESNLEEPENPLVLPGCRIPHFFLEQDGKKEISTLDLIKQNLVLIVGENGSPWVEAAKTQRMPIDVHILTKDSTPLTDSEDGVRQILKVAEGEALLVRPDGHVAWKGPKSTENHSEQLKSTLAEIFGQ